MKQSVVALLQFEHAALALRPFFAPDAMGHGTGIPLADRQAYTKPLEAEMQPDETPLKPGDEGPPDAPGVGEDACRACHGTGSVEGHRCAVCNGTGKVLQGIGGG